MKRSTLIFVVVAFTALIIVEAKIPNLTKLDDAAPILSDSRVEELSSQGLPWKAGKNSRFEGLTVAQVKKMMGVKQDEPKGLNPPKVVIDKSSKTILKGLPTEFDSRTKWPGCVGPVLDQGQCGSCWAFGAAESLGDRFCIATNGTVAPILSPQTLVSCDWEGNFGCNGGIPQLAWEYMEWGGMLTLKCFPYVSGSGTVPSCRSSCVGDEPYKVYYAAPFSQHTYLTAYQIQEAIMTSGPVEGTMDVYDDFMYYKNGVYVASSTASYLGGHAIKIIGWGHDDKSNLDYWIVQNSWGTSWGMDGLFWIQRGVDMCGIDHNAVAGAPYLKNL